MERLKDIRNWLPYTVSLLFILLFVYAAVSKLVDYENFRVQLGQSPLLTAYAHVVAWAVPTIELIIAGGLVLPKLRLRGLYASFTLMVMFTAYIVIILNFTEFIPCSCGGVLEDLGWTEHLIFNLVFIVLAATSILLLQKRGRNHDVLYDKREGKAKGYQPKKTLKYLCLLALGGVIVVTGLFLSSEEIVHHRNSFTRRYPHHPIKRTHELDLGFNSYYLAGAGQGKIYLANPTSPLHMLVTDTTLKDTQHIQMNIPYGDMRFRTIRTKVEPPHFYFMDGTVPVIFRGTVDQWTARPISMDDAYFSGAIPISPQTFVIRARSTQNNENELGLLQLGDSVPLTLNHDLLQKQIDGVFDTDGILLYDPWIKKVVYVHYYHNKIIIADSLLQETEFGKTIDTISFPQIKVASLEKRNQRKMAAPPLLVNKRAAVDKGYLFVQGNLLGKNESKSMWNKASIIDVYDLRDQSYVFSFYIGHNDGKRLEDFTVCYGKFIGIFDNMLIVFEIHREALPRNVKGLNITTLPMKY